jgi:hypothetical protein
MGDDLIELNLLWEPVRPYLVRQIEELHGRRDGAILEVGPFSGLIFDLALRNIGDSFLVAAFPPRLVNYYRDEAMKQGIAAKVPVIESDSNLTGVAEACFDFAVFRGAFFFPAFFRTNLTAIYSRLRAGGTAFVGGGFGKYTPDAVIESIRERSRDLNFAVGKIRITEESVREQVHADGLDGRSEILTEGGLWVVLRKGRE